ncbi:MAG: twin-arginine translocase subunit TatC [Chloroflexi bacterium]|nr:twin-arginine translocase subunit TatC [Chloroflexota bacterium]|tara:strand:- start:74 stop:844 length:771 start_codon:yes stop_codon:yes gene_type:complete
MENNQEEIALKSHLTELRNRFIVSAISIFGATIVMFFFHRDILTILSEPIRTLERVNQDGTSLQSIELVYTNATEMLGISMKISFTAGLIVAMPIIIYNAVMFISPGLTRREKKYLFISLPLITITFIAGILFGYYVLLPPAIHFLLTFNSDIASPMIRIGQYINLMVNLLFWLGFIFQTPFIMCLLTKINVANSRIFARGRKYAIVLAFILAAAITPTFDPINQILVAIPIIVLYELGIFLSWVISPRSNEIKTV